MADKDFLDYDLMVSAGFPPPVANALLTMWDRTGAARDVSKALDEIEAGTATWGEIEGNIDNQEDLQQVLSEISVTPSGETLLNYGSQLGNVSLNYQDADVQAITVSGDLTLTVTNWPVPDTPAVLKVFLYDANAHTVTLPSWTWAEGFEPTLSSHDRIVLYSEDGGETVYALRYFQASERTIKWGNVTGTLSNQTDLQAALDQAGPVLVGGDSSASNLDTIHAGDSTTSNTDTYHAGAA